MNYDMEHSTHSRHVHTVCVCTYVRPKNLVISGLTMRADDCTPISKAKRHDASDRSITEAR